MVKGWGGEEGTGKACEKDGTIEVVYARRPVERMT